MRRWYRQEYSLGNVHRQLAGVSIMAAWNDSSEGSAEALKQEEDGIVVSFSIYTHKFEGKRDDKDTELIDSMQLVYPHVYI